MTFVFFDAKEDTEFLILDKLYYMWNVCLNFLKILSLKKKSLKIWTNNPDVKGHISIVTLHPALYAVITFESHVSSSSEGTIATQIQI